MDEFTELNFPETKQCFANLTELVFTAIEKKDEIFSLLSISTEFNLFELFDTHQEELRFIKCIHRDLWEIDDIDNEKRNYYEEGLWLPNLKFLQVDYLDEYKEDSDKLSSILLECSPLINEI
ncbi:hypothetical protein C1645_817358 [Glomus cerebriforme]|uniref:Uncharacterized protein n=1 Tax=Glomus cerebriforme TaxID=658196 RepID=A0A397TAI8_9GLOM|nr:hypothetical protein C1645_817358 [Glomus cerebriforme]